MSRVLYKIEMNRYENTFHPFVTRSNLKPEEKEEPFTLSRLESYFPLLDIMRKLNKGFFRNIIPLTGWREKLINIISYHEIRNASPPKARELIFKILGNLGCTYQKPQDFYPCRDIFSHRRYLLLSDAFCYIP